MEIRITEALEYVSKSTLNDTYFDIFVIRKY
jgi:hypothetical protein